MLCLTAASQELENCNLFNKKPLPEKSNFLFHKKLWYGCLFPISQNHKAGNSRSRKGCNICKKIHTSVHGFKQKYKVIDGEVKRKFTV